MGYYIETNSNKNKADWLIKNARGVELPMNQIHPAKGQVPIIIVDNGPFEAAAIAFDEQELQEFIGNPHDIRPKRAIILPREEVIRLNPSVANRLSWA